ncbi:MAG: LLM class flavin-dependent oxidoreductase [Myxococcota bacterium]|jgi:alkanesulfonate monooxygenase SsuD/methylene tetrahydromethanopterin reductase-like flavin-dependent oxidoreductase (luciferase family)|nr:LLM class flavin-dependent oxidoreductase [Myxococcota bacterium]
MDFNHFLSSYYPDPTYGGDRLYADMLEQAVAAEQLGYRGVTLPEHHLINVLLTPSPLLMAVKVGAMTERIELVTSVVVLPLHDMRILAGEIVQADILTDGRLILGVGRGAFAYEMERLGSPIEESREKFDESLDVLVALLTREEVGWHGEWYDFEPLTIMPRPVRQPIPLMIAVMNPPGIAACTKRGFNIQTTPLSGAPELFHAQVAAHKEAKAEMGVAGEHLRVMMSRVIYCAEDAAHAQRMLERAHDYYGRFDNVFTGPGLVSGGCIDPLPCAKTLEELDEALIICPPAEMVDRLAEYRDAGIDEVILSSNMGQPQAEHLEAMERFASEVMPHLDPSTQPIGAA